MESIIKQLRWFEQLCIMIGYIKGTVEELNTDSVIVECSSMGFLIYVPSNYPHERLHIGDEVKLYTHMSVKEDDISLFGFTGREDLEMYELLLGVGGVGPKAALGVLSHLDPDSLKLAILSDDASSIAKAQGIGKKTAQKIILELKDKFSIDDIVAVKTEDAAGFADNAAVPDAVQALVALGYTNSEALKAVRKAASDTGSDETEVLLKAALKNLF